MNEQQHPLQQAHDAAIDNILKGLPPDVSAWLAGREEVRSFYAQSFSIPDLSESEGMKGILQAHAAAIRDCTQIDADSPLIPAFAAIDKLLLANTLGTVNKDAF